MQQIFWFSNVARRDSAVDAWIQAQPVELSAIAQYWFNTIRMCGEDVRELLHDGHPTACIGNAAFAYVNAFTAHVNVGFFHGSKLADPAQLLEGAGKYMRHVKLRPDVDIDSKALIELIKSAYIDMQGRLKTQ